PRLAAPNASPRCRVPVPSPVSATGSPRVPRTHWSRHPRRRRTSRGCAVGTSLAASPLPDDTASHDPLYSADRGTVTGCIPITCTRASVGWFGWFTDGYSRGSVGYRSRVLGAQQHSRLLSVTHRAGAVEDLPVLCCDRVCCLRCHCPAITQQPRLRRPVLLARPHRGGVDPHPFGQLLQYRVAGQGGHGAARVGQRFDRPATAGCRQLLYAVTEQLFRFVG